ncbi:tRNA (adenosine(37)-N6)-threonylcarbamoyltransferase complex dimerization subunit type 1 TsaB [Merismopedia glauca]|uniref:tRNA (Adenosine(37)-N6)-threonylcarbamoyltransferase complex dimerization subunit type 1 TsaB n=1 Tax=Merismopedia glauca CCAP 1448/3 TaxID=1296344 RepID=A0A2T1C7L0_9CYAN|nr:tRNA (adenosine(37)-N6)-threonylcarbamoyltransferase complex dimerization subunit type 1 TsaB [Merismopedia glauca]PSB04226.1 tRNA (adenosine(37)-N6)-threonylcarbamoyltransferase complex dimerization subunit type 1 TsaB [Merismopedia glauca CCAP 1448/3]
MNNSPIPHPYGLAIHTSSPELGLAIGNSESNCRCQVWNLGRDLSVFLHQYLLEFISPQTWADLGFIAVAIGPGSFTGTRIGVVTARTLAQQLDLPLYPVSSLAAVAWSNTQSSQSSTIAIQMPAQRGELFGAIYERSQRCASGRSPLGLSPLLPDTVISPKIWQEKQAMYPQIEEVIEITAGEGLGASVTSVWQLAHLEWEQGKPSEWSEVVPFYGQHPVDLPK